MKKNEEIPLTKSCETCIMKEYKCYSSVKDACIKYNYCNWISNNLKEASSKDIPKEFANLVNANFWDLI